MEPEPTVLDSLRRAVEAMPDDVPLRLHLATMLMRGGQRDEAIRQVGAVLQRDPGNAAALGLLQAGSGPAEAADQPPQDATDISAERTVVRPPATGPAQPGGEATGSRSPQYDWSQAEDELRDVLPAMFVGEGDATDAAGLDAVIAADPVTDWANPNVVRASKGTVFSVPVASASTPEALAWISDHGLQIVAAAPDASQLVTEADLTSPTVIAVGAEQAGLSADWLKRADIRVRIPMFGLADSLNVSTSAAIIAYEAVRQRLADGHR